MKNIEILISHLESKNPGTRNRAAIDLMDIGDPIAINPLIRAIRNPDNISHRGTLIYALGAFDCQNYLELLVELVLKGNYEVTAGAFQIIEEIDLSDSNVKEIIGLLSGVDRSEIKVSHNIEAYDSLLELVK